jgi:hypothetical protein
MPRYALPADMSGADLAPAEIQPRARHPEIVARGPAFRHPLRVRTRHDWMRTIAGLEIGAITGLRGLDFPSSKSQDMPRLFNTPRTDGRSAAG